MAVSHNELKDLLDYLSHFKSFSGFCVGVSALFPISRMLLPSVTPPWPEDLPVVASGCVLVTVFIGFLLFRHRRRSSVHRIAYRTALALPILIVIYALLLAFCLKRAGDDVYVVTTPWLTPEAQEAIDTGRVASDMPADLLQAFGFASADRVWQGRGVVKWLLAVCYCASLVTFAMTVSLLILRTTIAERRR